MHSSWGVRFIRLHIISVGKHAPSWIAAGFTEYARRFPPNFALHLTEVASVKRAKNYDIARIKQQEGSALLGAVLQQSPQQRQQQSSLVVALDERGALWDTQELAVQLQRWSDNWQSVSFLIGGADGLSSECLQRASVKWSLSKLTFPHYLVRLFVAEQLYRAWSVLQHRPYHRE